MNSRLLNITRPRLQAADHAPSGGVCVFGGGWGKAMNMQARSKSVRFCIGFILLSLSLSAIPFTGEANGVAADPQKMPLVRCEKGFLSVEAEGVPLQDLLGRLSRVCGIRFVHKGVEGMNRQISVRFRHLPVKEGIERLLRGFDYVLFYEGPSSRIAKAIIWPKEQGTSGTQEGTGEAPGAGEESNVIEDPSGMDNIPDIPPERPTGTGGDDTSLQSRGPSMASNASRPEGRRSQIAAVEALSQLKGSSRMNQLRKAATHQDPQVRMAAIEAIGSVDEGWAENLLEDAASSDLDEAIRERAREVLESRQ